MTDNPSFTVKSNVDTPSLSLDMDTPSKPNVLDELKKVIQKKVERAVVEIEVPERPGVSIRVSPNITQHQLKSWRKQAGDETKNGMDTIRFACSVVGHTTTAIIFGNEVVTDENGVNLTFASPEILAMTNTTRPLPDCVKAFFGIEPHIEAAAVAIMEAAGYGDSIDAVDPTMKPSQS